MDSQVKFKKQNEVQGDMFSDIITFDFIYENLQFYEADTANLCKEIIAMLQTEPINTKKLFYSKNFFEILELIPTIRPLIWRLMLNYLPEQRKRWVYILETNKKNYTKIVDEYMSTIKKNQKQNAKNNKNNNNTPPQPQKPKLDHPLSKKKDSKWNSYFYDNKLYQTILKDTKRTRTHEQFFSSKAGNYYYGENDIDEDDNLETPQQNNDDNNQENQNNIQPQRKRMNFFRKLLRKKKNDESLKQQEEQLKELKIQEEKLQQQLNQPKNITQDKKTDNKEKLLENQIQEEEEEEYNYEIITRILFIYAKLNPQIEYTQGMNEVCAVIYHCFYHDTSRLLRHFAESDTFYCFCILMTSIKSNFQKDDDEFQQDILQDNQQQKTRFMNHAIRQNITSFQSNFKKCDHILFKHFEQQKVDPKLYIVKWMIVLLAQDFEIDKVLRIWDAMMIAPNKMTYLHYVCIGILNIQRDQLLESDFSGILMNLQNISNLKIEDILQRSFTLYNQCYCNNDILSYFQINTFQSENKKKIKLEKNIKKQQNDKPL